MAMTTPSSNRLPAHKGSQPSVRHDVPTVPVSGRSDAAEGAATPWQWDADDGGTGTADTSAISPARWLGRQGGVDGPMMTMTMTKRSSTGGRLDAEQRPPRPRISRRRAVPAGAACLVILVAAVLAVRPPHMLVLAASDRIIYDDTLAPGWENWSWQSTVNFSNTSPLYADSRSIAWTANTGWSTLYLHARVPVSLSG